MDRFAAAASLCRTEGAESWSQIELARWTGMSPDFPGFSAAADSQDVEKASHLKLCDLSQPGGSELGVVLLLFKDDGGLSGISNMQPSGRSHPQHQSKTDSLNILGRQPGPSMSRIQKCEELDTTSCLYMPRG